MPRQPGDLGKISEVLENIPAKNANFPEHFRSLANTVAKVAVERSKNDRRLQRTEMMLIMRAAYQ